MKNLKAHLLTLLFILCGSSAFAAELEFDLAADLYEQKNYILAFEKFNSLAQHGDPRAQTVTALMYKFGEGVEQNYEASYYWYRKAAEQGYAPAQFHTGAMLADGLGTEENRAEAIHWLTMSAENGFERSIDKLAELNASAAVLGKDTKELIPWSKNWDLRLPNSLLRLDSNTELLDPGQSYIVQVGAMSTQTDANQLWEVLTSHHPSLFEGLEPMISLNESTGRRVYRISTGPFPDFRSADTFCGNLMASTIQAGCIPKKIN